MRRIASLVGGIALLMVSMAVSISAQEASPPAGDMAAPESFEIAPGVVADNMLFAEGSFEPSSYRLTFAPGVTYPGMPSPNLEVFYVESGSLVVTFDAPVTITRLGDVESGGEMIPAGTEFVIESGEFGVLQPGTGSEIRNEGSEPAAVSIAGLVPAGAGGATVASPEATPAG